MTCLCRQGGGEGSSNPLATTVLEGSGLSAPCPGRFTPGKHPVPIVQEAEWALGPV
jgi:hypothetical protein